MGDITGSRLGPFEIRSLLGTGGFATVYRAYDLRLKSEVAIKILAENHSLNLDTRERFLREAQALRRIKSTSIIGIHDIRETPDGRPYLIMEFADRGSIVQRRRQLTDNGWSPDASDVLCVVDAVANALDAVHAEELTHRDVTPSNLLIRRRHQQSYRHDTSVLGPDEEFVLSDLGLVKDQADGSGLTIGGGTIGFAAPEQQHALAHIDHRSDIFAASRLVLWLITGGTTRELPEWPEALLEDNWSSSFIATLAQGMEPAPEDRQQSIVVWQEDLSDALGRDGRITQPGGQLVALTPASGAARPRNRRNSILGFAAGVIVALGSLAAYRYAVPPSNDPENPASETLGIASEEAASPVSSPTSSEPTTSSTSSPARSLEVTTSLTLVDSPGPEMRDVFFDRTDEQVRLGLAWGAESIPEEVVGSEVQIAVNDGEWNTEVNTDPEKEITDSTAWFLDTAIFDGVKDRVLPHRNYRARARWLRDDGSVTEWSEPMVLNAES